VASSKGGSITWLLLLCLLLGGCTGALVRALEERQVASCIWWHSQFGTVRGVTATGGVPVAQCLAVPSQLP
jgi:hypothetical protein